MFGAKLSGAKFSWCQIVRVPNCPLFYLGAKLSVFIILVPNCPLYYLGAKLSGAKLSGAKLSGAKLSYNRSEQVQSRFRVGSEYVQRMFRVCSE